MARPKKDILTTGKVEAFYPHLNKPDEKFGDPTYKISVVFPSAEAAEDLVALIKTKQEEAIDEAVQEAKEKAKKSGKKFNEQKVRSGLKIANLPIKQEEDEDGDETGRVIIGAIKMKASGTTKDGKEWERKCPVFDDAGKPIDLEEVSIWGGSIVNVAFTADGFYVPALGAGCSLRLEAVQVLELRSGGSKDASGFGFATDGEGLPQNSKADTSDDDDEDEDSTSVEDDCPF